MYIVLDSNKEMLRVNEDGYNEIITYNKRFFNESIEELANGGSAYKNYNLGDNLFFYDIKDSLNIQYLEDSQGLFTFKIYDQLDYYDLIKINNKSILRLFKFAEKLQEIISLKDNEPAIEELFRNFNFSDLIWVYKYLLKKEDDFKYERIKYNKFLSIYETYLLDKSYMQSDYELADELCHLINFISSNKLNTISEIKFIDRLRNVIDAQKILTVEFLMLGEEILQIQDDCDTIKILFTYLKNLYSLIAIKGFMDENLEKNICKYINNAKVRLEQIKTNDIKLIHCIDIDNMESLIINITNILVTNKAF